jgi:hypothetical protein
LNEIAPDNDLWVLDHAFKEAFKPTSKANMKSCQDFGACKGFQKGTNNLISYMPASADKNN